MKKLLLFLFALPAFGQQIETDQPTETESPYTVETCVFQAENDFGFANGDSKTYYFPQSLLRYGLFKGVELRTEIRVASTDTASGGLLPVRIGTKIHLWDSKGALPEASVNAMLELPWLADGRWHNPYYEPKIRLLLSNEISERFTLDYNLGMLWQAENREPEYLYSLEAQYELGKRLKVFAEEYAFLPAGHHSEHLVDAGILWLLSDKIQLDIAGGSGLSSHSDDFFAKAGIAFRI